MALVLESAGRVRQKTRMQARTAAAQYALKAWFMYHATNKGNADLQLVNVGDADITGADGHPLADAPCVVYVVYIKKGTTATDAYFKLFDSATVDTTATEGRLVIPLLEAGEDQIMIFPNGLTMAAGVTGAAHTTYAAAVDSTALDAGDGFIIIGAAGGN